MLQLSIAYPAFRDALNALKPGWTVTERGLAGPGGAFVILGQRHGSEDDAHVDVQFQLDESNPQGPQLWDCVSGFGATPADKARAAAHIWSQTSGMALLEFKYSRCGEFADHYLGADRGGLQGWHVICGAILGYGSGESPTRLQRWMLDNPVLPSISSALSDSMDERECPHGIKILFGGDSVGEARLDGERHESASLALANLTWPRLKPAGFVRTYVVVLHRDSGEMPSQES
jgi:hypothetical protein